MAPHPSIGNGGWAAGALPCAAGPALSRCGAVVYTAAG